MKFDTPELDAIADDLAKRLVPRILAELREQLKPQPNGHQLVGAVELAELLGLSENTVRARAEDGTIPSIPIGRLVRFSPAAVIEALKSPS